MNRYIFKHKTRILAAYVISLFVTASFCQGQNLIQNPGCDEPMVNNRIPSWEIISDTGWTAKSVNVVPYDGIAFFSPGKEADSKLKQEIDLSGYKRLIDLGLQNFQFTAFVTSYPQSPVDESNIQIEFYDQSNSLLSSLFFGPYRQTEKWKKVDSILHTPRGSRKVVIILHSIRHNGEKNNGYYDGLSLVALHPNLTDINAAICEGQTYYGHNAAGIYVDSFYSVDGSDSIRILNLTVINRHDPDLGADKEICEGDSVRLFPGNFSSYVWQDGSTKEYFVAKKTGRYSVMVANSCGSTQDEILITTRVCDIYFPSAFTPNKDGKNDLFKALNGYHIEEFHLSVYNRWGQKLFETNDQNKGWDGSFNNQPQDMGVYIWYCYYKRNNQYKKLNGTITLLR